MLVVITRVDAHIMESDKPILNRGDFMRMVCNNLDSKMEQTWRVRILEGGAARLQSFAMPQKNLDVSSCLNDVSQLPDWIRQRIAVLQICEYGDIIEGVGQKISDKVFYVIE
jgi:hypothetical protein